MNAAANGDLITRREGAAGIIRLNRPKALNALTLDMTRGIAKALDAFEADPNVALVLLEGAGERGLCAGGDLRGLYESARAGGDLGKIFWREEYLLNARIADYRKPYVALMGGIVMGGGVGIAAHGSHRIATENTKLAMPEVGVGFFPDVGGTWLLSRAPGEAGLYFGMTGQAMTGADAVGMGFADTVVGSEKLPALRAALTQAPQGADAAVVGRIVHGFAAPATIAPIAARQGDIDRLFAHDSVENIVAMLTRDASAFALATLKSINEKSPVGLKLTFELVRQARYAASLKQCLVSEYRAALEIFANHDFPEGIRAAVIDKDRAPKWRPARLEDVTPEMVGRYLAPRGADELVFPQ